MSAQRVCLHEPSLTQTIAANSWPRENRWGTERNWMMREEPWPGEDTELVSEQPYYAVVSQCS